jgi:cytochrome c peroxidase
LNRHAFGIHRSPLPAAIRRRADMQLHEIQDDLPHLKCEAKGSVLVSLLRQIARLSHQMEQLRKRSTMTRNRCWIFQSILVAAALASAGCANRPVTVDTSKLQGFAPLPAAPVYRASDSTTAKVDLGRMLYYDARLSKNQTVSCNSCHRLSLYGVDGKATSEGQGGQRGSRNSPTVYNASMQFRQFWDGRAPDVEKQAQGPLLNPIEMAMPSEQAVVERLKAIPGYKPAFQKAFPGERDPITLDHVSEAIGVFERGLRTPSRWDAYLQGDQSTLTALEKAGFNQFVDAGCAMCHSGDLVGGHAYQKLGVRKEYSDTSDPGRYAVTQNQSDRMVFKVPSLRNVAMTGPFFHNGKVETLEEAVTQMAMYQTGKPLSPEGRDSIIVWLKCLTGEIDVNYVKPPALPQGEAGAL